MRTTRYQLAVLDALAVEEAAARARGAHGATAFAVQSRLVGSQTARSVQRILAKLVDQGLVREAGRHYRGYRLYAVTLAGTDALRLENDA